MHCDKAKSCSMLAQPTAMSADSDSSEWRLPNDPPICYGVRYPVFLVCSIDGVLLPRYHHLYVICDVVQAKIL